MTDTDRLAALLHELRIECRPDWPDCDGRFMNHTDPAERLIAAGVHDGSECSAVTRTVKPSAPAPAEGLRETARLPRNVILSNFATDDGRRFSGHWVAVPKEDFDALRAALEAKP